MTDLTQVYNTIEARSRSFEKSREQDVRVRLWDGNWNEFAEVVGFYEVEFEFEDLDAGAGSLTLPIDHSVAQAMMDPKTWPTKSMYVTFDKDGSRWSGRLVNHRVHVSSAGEQHVEFSFVHDYIKLKELLVWANPFLPDLVQFPKAWMLFGPSRWVVATTLFVNLLRKNNSLWKLPDDPLNFSQWFDLGMTNWNIVVKPVDFGSDSSLTAVVSSRFKYFHDCVVDVCRDAQLAIEVRRYLPGDPEPIPGKSLRYGCLVVEVVDKSGWNRETSFGGNIINGLVRQIRRVMSDGVTEGLDTIPRVEFPEEYYKSGFMGSLPSAPWVVLEHGPRTGMVSSDFEYVPPGPYQFVTGGSSMPMVNETIKAAIVGIGGIIGSILGQSQLGTVADSLLEPLYSDVFFAFQSHKDHKRISEQGWDAPFEQWVDGSDKAHTLAALISIRRALYETRERFSVSVEMEDGAPYWVGTQGQGDFFVGDRVAVHALGMPENQLFVERVEKLRYSTNSDGRGWEITIGKPEYASGIEFVSRRLDALTGGLRELGVW